MRDKVTFLTGKDFDVELLIENLENNSGSVELVQDKEVLNEIISLLRKKDFSLLSPQEIHFLKSNSEDVLAEYLIFRYNMNYFRKK